MTSVTYYGGHLREWRYADGMVVYREPECRGREPVASRAVRPNDMERMLLSDALNLIVKLDLDRQTDIHPAQPGCDGGEVEYEFSVGKHKGRFKVINNNPKRLEQFQYKCRQLQESFKANTGKSPVQSAWADSADGQLSLTIFAPAAESDVTQPLVLSAYLRNKTQRTLTVLRPFANASAVKAGEVEIVGFRGQVRYIGSEKHLLGRDAFVRLRPGEDAWGEIELDPAKHKGLDQPDTYMIRYAYNAGEFVTDDFIPKNTWTGQIISSAITISRRQGRL